MGRVAQAGEESAYLRARLGWGCGLELEPQTHAWGSGGAVVEMGDGGPWVVAMESDGWGDGQCGASDLGPELVVGLLREEAALWCSRFG